MGVWSLGLPLRLAKGFLLFECSPVTWDALCPATSHKLGGRMELGEGRTGGEPSFLPLLPLPLPLFFRSMVLPLFTPFDRFFSFHMMRYLRPEISPRNIADNPASLCRFCFCFCSKFNELGRTGGGY